ncbi:unnamed protein product, partial [Amoebophrya sp. A25]
AIRDFLVAQSKKATARPTQFTCLIRFRCQANEKSDDDVTESESEEKGQPQGGSQRAQAGDSSSSDDGGSSSDDSEEEEEAGASESNKMALGLKKQEVDEQEVEDGQEGEEKNKGGTSVETSTSSKGTTRSNADKNMLDHDEHDLQADDALEVDAAHVKDHLQDVQPT